MSVVLVSWCQPAEIGDGSCSADRVSGCFDVAGTFEVSLETFDSCWNPNGRGAGMNVLEAPAGPPLHDDGITPLLHRVRGEFLEMPGLRLTPAQAARLWSLDRSTSDRILDGLTIAGFLLKNRSGAYLLASVG
jgi:hypothetical protein